MQINKQRHPRRLRALRKLERLRQRIVARRPDTDARDVRAVRGEDRLEGLLSAIGSVMYALLFEKRKRGKVCTVQRESRNERAAEHRCEQAKDREEHVELLGGAY